MAATADRVYSEITTEPQPINLHGARTTVELTVAFTAKCGHGHEHALYVTDISDVEEAAARSAIWASRHVNDCPGPAITLRAV